MSHRNIRLVEFNDEEIYQPEMSAHGTNAYYCEFCNHAGYRPNYASCLRRIADRKAGRLDTNEAQCSTAIGNKACMALEMQKEEKQAGKAIYYVNRVKMRQNQVENAALVGIKLGQRVSRGLVNPKPIVVTPQGINMNIPQGIFHAPQFKTSPTFADAINKKMNQLAKQAANTKAETVNSSTTNADHVNFNNLVGGDLFKQGNPPTQPIKTEGLSLLEIARLRKKQAINA